MVRPVVTEVTEMSPSERDPFADEYANRSQKVHLLNQRERVAMSLLLRPESDYRVDAFGGRS